MWTLCSLDERLPLPEASEFAGRPSHALFAKRLSSTRSKLSSRVSKIADVESNTASEELETVARTSSSGISCAVLRESK